METRTELTKLQFYTMSTCGEACWEACEDVCRCSCGGANHGILRNGGDRPERTCKISGKWYKLHTVTDYPTAKSLCRELRENDAKLHPDNYPNPYGDKPMVYYDSKPGDAYHCKAPTASRKKWSEITNAGVTGYMVLVWERVEHPFK